MRSDQVRYEKYLTVALSIQCFCFLQSITPVWSFLSGTETGGEGTGKDILTALWSSLLRVLWAKVLYQSLPAQPNPTCHWSGCFTLGQLFLRSSWNDHKETTIHHNPTGKTVVLHTGNLNVVKCSSSSTPCPKMAV